MDIALLKGAEIAFLLLQTVAASVLDDVRMWVRLDFLKQFDFLAKDELGLLIVEANFLHTLDIALLVHYFIDYAVASTNDLSDFEPLVEIALSTDELYNFIAH